MDSDKLNRNLIKLKAKAIKAVLRGKRGPKAAKIRIRYIRWVFRFHKDNIIIKDQSICQKVWKEIANKSGGRCLGGELERKRIRIREIRLEINRKLHGKDLDSINLDIPLYIERITDPEIGLRLIVFDPEKIQSAIDEDRKKMVIKATVLSKTDLDDNIIDFWHKYNREIYWQLGYEAYDTNNGLSKDEINIVFLHEPQKVVKKVRYIQKAIYEDCKQFKSKHKPYFLPFTLFALFKVKTPIYPRKIELVLKTTNYFNFLAVQEYLKEFREKINIIDVLRPIPGISHSISPAALLIIEDKGTEVSRFS